MRRAGSILHIRSATSVEDRRSARQRTKHNARNGRRTGRARSARRLVAGRLSSLLAVPDDRRLCRLARRRPGLTPCHADQHVALAVPHHRVGHPRPPGLRLGYARPDQVQPGEERRDLRTRVVDELPGGVFRRQPFGERFVVVGRAADDQAAARRDQPGVACADLSAVSASRKCRTAPRMTHTGSAGSMTGAGDPDQPAARRGRAGPPRPRPHRDRREARGRARAPSGPGRRRPPGPWAGSPARSGGRPGWRVVRRLGRGTGRCPHWRPR